jgi:sugar transferase (PEP-CTERM/EpsH1 system associated)
MKLLWLNASLLLPLDKGGRLRTWHLMRHLASRHDITYLAFEGPSDSAANREGMREVCGRLVTVPQGVEPVKGTWRFYAQAARYVFDRVPYAVSKYRSSAYRRQIERLLAEERFDAIVCDFLPPAINLRAQPPCPSILFTHNVEAEIWRRHAETATNIATKYLFTQQWRRMLRFEGAALSRFDLVLAVSAADSRTFSRLYCDSLRAPIHVVQTGVDTEYFRPADTGASRTHLVFTGSMDWLPNEDAMTYFCAEILPRIRQSEPDATLSIIGRSPTSAVRKLAELAGVEVTGRVDDVRPHIARGSVYIVPLRIGGGTRLKIFEAMAMGKAVVSTTVGAEGLPVTTGRDIEIADEPARFAHAVVRLMRDKPAREQIETAARRLVVDRYDWSAVAIDFEAALQRVTNGRAAGSGHDVSKRERAIA